MPLGVYFLDHDSLPLPPKLVKSLANGVRGVERRVFDRDLVMGVLGSSGSTKSSASGVDTVLVCLLGVEGVRLWNIDPSGMMDVVDASA